MEVNHPLAHKFLNWVVDRITGFIEHNFAHDVLHVHLCVVANAILNWCVTCRSDRLAHVEITRLYDIGQVDSLSSRVLLRDAVVIAHFFVALPRVNHLCESVPHSR